MRSDRNEEIHTEIRDGILTRLIDEGPALVAAVMVTVSSTVIGWGMYSDLAEAFQSSSREGFTAMLGLVVTIIATVGYGLGRISGMSKAKVQVNYVSAPVPVPAPSPATKHDARKDFAAFSAPKQDPDHGIGASATVTVDAESKEERLRFLSEAAQELRAPLTSMCLAARIIRKHHESTPEVVERFGETMVLEADKLGEMIDEFLDLVRIESNCVEWSDDEVDPAELLDEAISQIEPLAIGYGVGVSFVLEPDLSPIRADHARMRQVLSILLGIAVREAADDVEICIQIAEATGGWVLSVGDSRSVYSHTEAHRIRVRGDEQTTAVDRSTDQSAHGIGVKVCREIVSRYHGRIWFEGNLSDSGCIRVTVPYPTEKELAGGLNKSTAGVKRDSGTPDTAEFDLASRHEAAVRALSERASHQQPGAKAAQDTGATEADDEFESVTGDSYESTPAETATATVSEPESKVDGEETTEEASDFADEPQSETDEAAHAGEATPVAEAAAPAEAPGMTEPVVPVASVATTQAEPTAEKEAAVASERAEDSATNVPSTQEHSKPDVSVRSGIERLAALQRAAAKSSAERSGDHPAANAGATASRGAEDTLRAKQPPRRPTLGRTVAEGESATAQAHKAVTGMAISARRRPGSRPMLALNGPEGAPSADGGSSVRAASDKAMLELAFARDGGDEEVSREEAELVARATGTTLAPYSRRSRASRSVRTASSVSNREPSAGAGEPGQRRTESSGQQEKRGRLDDRLAKRLGID